MPQPALDAMAKAVPDDVVKAIVGDNYNCWTPTPSALKSVVDELVAKFNPKAD